MAANVFIIAAVVAVAVVRYYFIKLSVQTPALVGTKSVRNTTTTTCNQTDLLLCLLTNAYKRAQFFPS